VFNTVGDPYFQAAHKSLALRGRQILIAGRRPHRAVQHPGILIAASTPMSASIRWRCRRVRPARCCANLGPGFASGHLKPFPINPSAIYPLEDARRALMAVAGSSRDRVILRAVTIRPVIARSEATKQSRISLLSPGLLRFARSDGQGL